MDSFYCLYITLAIIEQRFSIRNSDFRGFIDKAHFTAVKSVGGNTYWVATKSTA